WELKQPYYRGREDLTVVGIAKGYQDAVMLVMRIADECYRKNGDGDIRSFLTDKIQKEGAK
ncbi:MAG: hypothetical protein PUB22_02020, partial [Clostridiales bacterium]|nr:hypothetical protein [Clostridiales bacterium]